jgi:SagB-type dehydrogenase family enzyme
MPDALTRICAYHQLTKHSFQAYAPGPGRLDWATQPDPFRRYSGAPLVRLAAVPIDRGLTGEPDYDAAYAAGCAAPAPLNLGSVSRLFFDSLALSAWKRAGPATWALRVNPSSGNLHPTEGYLIAGPVTGLSERALVAHYAPKEHALEIRAEFPAVLWQRLARGLPADSLLVGLSSIHWREAWKYGERAYRYCQHDVGHALGAISLAASGLGWQASLLDNLGTDDLACLLGLFDPQGSEPEQPDGLIALYPQGHDLPAGGLDPEVPACFKTLRWCGRPNRLSSSHAHWPALEEAALAARKPATRSPDEHYARAQTTTVTAGRCLALRRIIQQRRSAVAMDGITSMPCGAFYQALLKTLPNAVRFPFSTLPWAPRVHLAIFAHRVQGLAPGLYLLVRDASQYEGLRSALRPDFLWERPASCPEALPLYLLAGGDARRLATEVSCFQDIAGDGCFSLGMIAEFQRPLERYGPWFYPRLFWECGMIGQVLYLEAEAAGLRGTGIGCFFDDPMHEVLGLDGLCYQDLYHFTLGGPLEDARLSTLPAYPPASPPSSADGTR